MESETIFVNQTTKKEMVKQMGVYVDLYKINFEDYINELMKEPKINDRKMLKKIMLEFGEKIGDQFILLNNEYYEDYNSYYSMFHLIDSYFEIEEYVDIESFDVFLEMREEMVSNMNQYEVAEGLELDIEWQE